jgi:hypothetical protein
MSTLTVRFMGICCFLDSWGKTSHFSKRILLPVDMRAGERDDGRHIPYLELDILDEPQVTGDFTTVATYTREGRAYRRFHLSGDRIRILNAATPENAQLNVLNTFRERVPSLTALTPELADHLPSEYFSVTPPRDRVAAYFDVHHGDLHAGPSTIFPIRFDPVPGSPAIPPRRLAGWVELQIPITEGEGPVIEVKSFGESGLGTRTIRLSTLTDCVTIGNQLESDIAMLPFDPAQFRNEDFREHFLLYYDLYPTIPANLSRPSRTASAINGCVNGQIP